ncbi:uncharacterized protein TNCV_858211 [Trichonephila clavipes]|nr:uncharacterized protein TNCV_858211 [Trichonephila clavipes]
MRLKSFHTYGIRSNLILLRGCKKNWIPADRHEDERDVAGTRSFPDAWSINPYSKLKDEVIARCGESKSQEIRRLLAGEQLGDRKPSELFRVMQRRSESHNVTDSLFLELFLQQLPPNVQSILASIQPLTAQKASEVAGRILKVTSVQVSATSKYSSANSDDSSESKLLKELKLLRQEVKELRRNRFDSRNRGKSPKPKASNLCWYHNKFATKARKCIQPCSFQENLNGQE